MTQIERYKKSVELDPKDLDAWVNLADAYYDEGIFHKAVESYEKAIELNPDYEDIWNNLGLAYSYEGENDKAIECYKKAIELNPDDAVAHYNMAYAYEDKGEEHDDEAIKYYKKALELDPGYVEVLCNLALIYRDRKEFKKSIQYYQRAIAINPEKHPKTKSEMANNLIAFLTSPEIQKLIGNYGVKEYGRHLFTPCAGAEPSQ